MDLPKFDPLQLDETDFIVDLDAQNVCFLPLPIFTRISEMLSPSDFVHLAQTCRYMHWRMFTYGHLMLKHHLIFKLNFNKIQEIVTIKGSPRKYDKMIIRRPYVYVEYLHLQIDMGRSSSIFDDVINYVSTAKKRTKHYCVEISNPQHVCTQQTFQDVNNLIERLNPFHLKLHLSWNDHKLSVEIPSIRNIYSVSLPNYGDSRKTEFNMNPCAKYYVYTIQDFCDIVQEFTRNSRLQFHICYMMPEIRECRTRLEKEWNLQFKKIDETPPCEFSYITFYASIPSEHGDVEIFIKEGIVIRRKETYIGQWKDFYSNVTKSRSLFSDDVLYHI